jgi:malonyl-CoA O-methyltransferase
MFDTKTVQQNFSRAAEQYDEHAQIQHAVREECVVLAQSFWPAGSSILDAGGGTGAMAKLAPNWNITNLDLAFGMCQIASKHVPTVNASAEAMPFADNSFDGVFSCLMLQWANDPLITLREIARVLKPQSRALIATFVDGTLDELRQSFTALDATPHVSAFIEPYQLSALSVHAGFMVLSAERETITAHYPDTLTLMRSIKSIGATNKDTTRSKGLMTPKKLKTLEHTYRKKFATQEGLPATWNVIYLLLEKRA